MTGAKKWPAIAVMALSMAAVSCEGSDGAAQADGGADSDADTDSDTDGDADTDTGTDTGPEPFGEIVIEQLYLPAFNMGEAILVIGPDGTSVLIDTANDSHTPRLLEAIERRVGERRLDWVILTHYHNDHIGGFDNLFTPTIANGSSPVEVERGLISRGLLDVAADMIGVEDFDEMCEAMAGWGMPGERMDLCEGAAGYDCSGGESGVPWPASGCAGLLLGDLDDPSDDGDGTLTYIDLGGGARLYLFQANGHLALDGEVVYARDEGLEIGHGATYPENARSLGGAIRWGDFSYLFNGDTPAEGPALEDFIATRKAELTTGPGGPPLIPDGAHDVTHMSHHGIDTSTGQQWVDWLMPDDGASRNAVVGTTSMYFQSPSQAALDRVGPRVQDGWIWTTELGLTPGAHPRLQVADGAVEVVVATGGTGYTVTVLTETGPGYSASYDSTGP